MNVYQNLDINLPKNKSNFKSNTFKEISLSTCITLDDFQSSDKSISSISINPKITHYNIFLTPSSFNQVNGENIKISGYKLSVFGIINEVIIFENIKCHIRTCNTYIPFYTSITLPSNTDISEPICIDTYIKYVNVFCMSPKEIFQNICILVSVT